MRITNLSPFLSFKNSRFMVNREFLIKNQTVGCACLKFTQSKEELTLLFVQNHADRFQLIGRGTAINHDITIEHIGFRLQPPGFRFAKLSTVIENTETRQLINFFKQSFLQLLPADMIHNVTRLNQEIIFGLISIVVGLNVEVCKIKTKLPGSSFYNILKRVFCNLLVNGFCWFRQSA